MDTESQTRVEVDADTQNRATVDANAQDQVAVDANTSQSDMVPRSDFEREVRTLKTQRQEAKEQLRVAQESAVTKQRDLYAQIEKLKSDNEVAIEDVKALHSKELRTRDFADAVMMDVAPGSREQAKLLLDGYLFRKEFDPFNPETEVKDLAIKARERIAKLNPGLYLNSTIGTGTPTTPGTDWDKFQSWNDVPPDLKVKVPDEHFLRLTRITGRGDNIV